MPRITGKEAEGLMAAYAKVHAPKEEEVAIEEPVTQTPAEDIQERLSPIQQRIANKIQTQKNLQTATAGYKFSGSRDSSGALSSLRADPINNNSNNTVTSKGGVERTVTKNDGGGINIQKGKDLDAQTDDLIANTPTVKNSKFGNKKLDKPTLDKGGNTQQTQQQQQTQQPKSGSGSVKFSGSQLKGLLDSQKGIGNSGGQQQTGGQQGQEKSFGQRQIEKAKMRGNPAAQAQDRMKRGTPVNQLFNKGGGNQQPQPQPQQQQTGTQGTQQPVKTVGGQGNRQREVKTGGIQLGKSIRGGLRGLGNLAGRVAAGARNVAGNVKQGVQSAASGIKKGAQAVAGALQNKGPIQGRLSGPQRRAQQTQQKPVPQAAQKAAPQAQAQAAPANSGKVTPTAAQTAAAKADTTSPAAKAGLSADLRAQAAANTAAFKAKRASQTPLERRNERLAAMRNKGRPLLRNEYDPTEDLFDDTVEFLISEGYVQDINEAINVMAEPEFREGFDEGIQQVLNESSENNK